ncbi:unnamed protein product, partial [Hapterophycus canaliculatus]
VARVWADKVVEWVALGEETELRRFWGAALGPIPFWGISVSPLAGLLQGLCVLVLLRGVELGKRVTTIVTALKMAVCAFMIIGGLALFEPSNMVPFAPMGASGVIKGSSVAFFGYLGYDEV